MRPLKNKPIKIKDKTQSSIKSSNILKKQNLIEFWQLLFFSTTSILFFFTYINQAWKPIKSKQIEITGLSGITKNDIKKATSNFFPNHLLKLNPKEIEYYLIKKLPIKEISVSRRFFPPRIYLSVLEREPIAFASKVSANKIEKGMIDIEGNWIPLKFVSQSKINKSNIYVENLTSTKKNDISIAAKS